MAKLLCEVPSGIAQAKAKTMARVDALTKQGRSLEWLSAKGSRRTPTRQPYTTRLEGMVHRFAAKLFRIECDLMYVLQVIFLTIVNLVKQAWLLPKTITLAREQRRRQTKRDRFETERLERIRNQFEVCWKMK
jgi:hypothetical protein